MPAAQEPERYIRPYKPGDYTQVADILQQNGSFHSRDHSRRSFDATQKDWGEESVLVHVRSELGKRAVTGVVRTTFMASDRRKALIGDLMVSPSVQSRGTGTRLLEAMENVLYARGCLPELLTNAQPNPYTIGNSQLLRFYGERGFGDAYSVVGMIGRENGRLLEDQRPESLYTSAWVHTDKIYDSLFDWHYTDLQQQIVPGLFPPALFSSLKRKVEPDNQVIEPPLTTEKLHLGYPHRRFTDSNNRERLEVWSALKPEVEGFKILRMLTLPSNFFEDDTYSPGIDGLYVFKSSSEHSAPWLKFIRVEGGAIHHLRQVTDKEWADMLRHNMGRPSEGISDTALEAMGYCAAIAAVIRGRNTVDDLRRYDRRWCGETGYPWLGTVDAGKSNCTIPSSDQTLTANADVKITFPDDIDNDIEAIRELLADADKKELPQ